METTKLTKTGHRHKFRATVADATYRGAADLAPTRYFLNGAEQQ